MRQCMFLCLQASQPSKKGWGLTGGGWVTRPRHPSPNDRDHSCSPTTARGAAREHCDHVRRLQQRPSRRARASDLAEAIEFVASALNDHLGKQQGTRS